MRPHPSDLLYPFFVPGDHHSPFSGHQILVGKETETPYITEDPTFLPLIFCSRSMGCIFNDIKTTSFGNLHNGWHVARVSTIMHYHDSFCPWSDFGFNFLQRDIEIIKAYDI